MKPNDNFITLVQKQLAGVMLIHPNTKITPLKSQAA